MTKPALIEVGGPKDAGTDKNHQIMGGAGLREEEEVGGEEGWDHYLVLLQ